MLTKSEPPPAKPQPPPPPPSAASAPAAPEAEGEAARLLALAEDALAGGRLRAAHRLARGAARLRPALPSAARLLAAVRVLRADASSPHASLLLPPSSSLSSAALRRHFKSLTRTLQSASPSSPAVSTAADEALRRATAAFRLLSSPSSSAAAVASTTFWTACAACRLLHEFDRRYVGYRLVCPGCRKSFLASEVPPPPEAPPPPPPPLAAKKPKTEKREKTLAEMQLELARKRRDAKDHKSKKNCSVVAPKDANLAVADATVAPKDADLAVVSPKDADLGLMAVEDSDFYDFDKDRAERCIQRGQVWALYDDDDGMPRNYGLVDEILLVSPFRARIHWLELQCHGKAEKTLSVAGARAGADVACGQFKVGRTITLHSVNVFSHLAVCERVAREVYRIYPKKGTVWALYGSSEGNARRKYDIVVLLSSYSEMYGVSIAYLEKVKGYKSIFTRQAVGCHAVRWLAKGDTGLFSHQIPARKVSAEEHPELPPGVCWELDPASLPPELLHI